MKIHINVFAIVFVVAGIIFVSLELVNIWVFILIALSMVEIKFSFTMS